MKVINRVELKLDGYEKCHLLSDNDCPLGQLYDYTCALQMFILDRIKAAEEAKKVAQEPVEKTEAQSQE